MHKRILLIMMITALALCFTACGEESGQPADTQASESQTEESSGTGLEWPSEYMSTLPAPESKISAIGKLNGTEEIAESDTTTQPSSVNVVMNEMSKKEALAYYETLKNSGFTINSDEKDSDKILLVGALNDADGNPFLFSYDFEYELGNISITILNAVYSGDIPVAISEEAAE
ncbi:MAG: hypothetical protein KA282_02950 [Clostridia bacterium]|nr:hypothetical protein [Clostridia bacterium]